MEPRSTMRAFFTTIAPIALFAALYLALFVGISSLFSLTSLSDWSWAGLVAALAASIAVAASVDRPFLRLGIFVSRGRTARSLLGGLAAGAVLVGAAHLVMLLVGAVEHAPGTRFPVAPVLFLFLPAAIHEELLFRGYPFQKLASFSPTLAVAVTSALFALLHAGNEAVGTVALLNIFLAGVLLGLSYLVAGNLWFPIAFHLAWNVMSGPLLGHEVSGFQLPDTLLTTIDAGHPLLSGGDFGIEASIIVTLLETAGIALLARRLLQDGQRRKTANITRRPESLSADQTVEEKE